MWSVSTRPLYPARSPNPARSGKISLPPLTLTLVWTCQAQGLGLRLAGGSARRKRPEDRRSRQGAAGRGREGDYKGASSPSQGGFPPRRFMILSNALKSARAFRSAKNRAVWSAETFSATAVATNWLILVRSSRLRRTTASLSDRGSRKGYVRVSFIESFLSPLWVEELRPRIARGVYLLVPAMPKPPLRYLISQRFSIRGK